ncbi:MAG: hypothetical protein KY395_05525 [Actinobacteria bacterium]|nr:hypothetical protein [Actinomycetota bacterium]
MKNRSVRALLVGFTAIGVLLAGSPANAASLTWEDEAGDAKDLAIGTDALPNDPAFDITKVTIETVDGKLVWTAELPEMAAGRPTYSTGYYFRFAFTHAAVNYWFIVGEDPLGAQNFSLSATATGGAKMECKDCKAEINREAKAVIIEAPMATLDADFKKAEAPPVSGSEWSKLYVIAQRRTGVFTLTADTADAPEGAIIQF